MSMLISSPHTIISRALRVLLYFGLFSVSLYAQGYPLAVIKSTKGSGQLFDQKHTLNEPLKAFQKIYLNHQIETKEEAKVVLRLFKAQGQFTMYASSNIKFIKLKLSKKTLPTLELVSGSLDLNFSKEAGSEYLFNTENTLVETPGARWFALVDKNSTTKLVVIKGTLKVYNRPKDMSANVPHGKTCYSDKDGLRIATSTAEDLSLLRHNIIEVDFIDPVSNQIKTLELEYESNF